MAIASHDDYVAAAKQLLPMVKTAARTSVAINWFSVFDLAGNPGAGTLNVGNTAAGLVPTDATAGYPSIGAFGGGALGYLANVDFGNTVAARIALFDRLFVAGAFTFNAAVTLASQPSYSARLPTGPDYSGLELWLEQVTAGTLVQNVAVTYTNQDGVTGRTTGTVATAANTVGRCWPLPLQAGDTGVQKIESVTGTVASAGTFNIMVLRRLWQGRVRSANDGDVHDYLKTGLPQLFADSALYALINADSTSTGLPDLALEIANG